MVSNDIEVGRCANRSRSSQYGDDDDDDELGLPGQQINADNSVRRHRQRRRADGRTDGGYLCTLTASDTFTDTDTEIQRYRATQMLRYWYEAEI